MLPEPPMRLAQSKLPLDANLATSPLWSLLSDLDSVLPLPKSISSLKSPRVRFCDRRPDWYSAPPWGGVLDKQAESLEAH